MTAQTISGTVSLVVKCANVQTTFDNGPAAQPALYVHLRVVDSIGSASRVVLSLTPAPGATPNTAAQGWAETLETRIVPPTALTSFVVNDGDRLVLTIGKHGNFYDAHSFSFVWGDPVGTADHTLSAGQTMVGVPWVEFSQDLFGAAGPVTYQASGTITAVATTSGNPTPVSTAQTLAASGTAVVVSTTSGDPTRTPLTLAASGTTAASTGVTGNPTRVPRTLAASGTIDVIAATLGDATRQWVTLAASGTVAAVTFTSGAVIVTGTAPILTNITVTGTLLPRRWAGQLQARRWEGTLL